MLFFVLMGVLIFSDFINVAGSPPRSPKESPDSPRRQLLVMAVIVLIYLTLGCVLESLSMVQLTVPVFYPVVQSLGFDLAWFGIVVVVATEISLITPPIGLNVFVLKSVLPDIETGTIFRGVVPFWIADMGRLALIVLVPPVASWLPRLLR